jgi:hypothetical protein
MKFSKGKVSIHTLQEVLVYLATQGTFNNVEVPDWATGGTMVEEVMEALRTLGDATDGQEGIPAGFDEWFTDYCRGDDVCDPDSIEAEEEDDDD